MEAESKRRPPDLFGLLNTVFCIPDPVIFLIGVMVKIKAVSLDFWNTLFTEAPGGFRRYQETRTRLLKEAVAAHGDFTDEQIEAAFSRESQSHNRIWREEHRTLIAAQRLDRTLAYLEVQLNAVVRAQLAAAYEDGILEYPPVLIEGVREAIAVLASRYRLGIISDIGFSPGRVLRKVMRDAGILEAFDSCVFSDEAGRSKPHREVFARTTQALAVEPHEIVHIGDLEFTDIIGAKQAGFHAIRFTGATPMQEGEETMADQVTKLFRDVPRLIESLSNSG